MSTPTTPPPADPSPRRDRVAVLASTVIREIATARIDAIRKESTDLPPEPVVLTPFLKRALRDYTMGERMKARAEREIKREGYTVDHDGGCREDRGYKIGRPYEHRDAKRRRLIALKDGRIATIREMRTNALIDLTDPSPTNVKAAIRAFREKVEKI